jgi:hypothetical protein
MRLTELLNWEVVNMLIRVGVYLWQIENGLRWCVRGSSPRIWRVNLRNLLSLSAL